MMLNGLILEIYFMKIRLVDGAIKTLKPRRVAYNVHDPEGTGLILRVLPQRRKNWVVSYRSPTGIKQQRPIGRFPAMRIAEAREAVLSALSVRPRSF